MHKDPVKKNFAAKAIEKKKDGHLFHLGHDDSRWLEGGAWKNLGCLPCTEGLRRRQQSMAVWGLTLLILGYGKSCAQVNQQSLISHILQKKQRLCASLNKWNLAMSHWSIPLLALTGKD